MDLQDYYDNFVKLKLHLYRIYNLYQQLILHAPPPLSKGEVNKVTSPSIALKNAVIRVKRAHYPLMARLGRDVQNFVKASSLS